MLRVFFGNLIFAIIARMLCGNHLNLSTPKQTSAVAKVDQNYEILFYDVVRSLSCQTLSNAVLLKF